MTVQSIPGVYQITPGHIRKSEKQKKIEAEIMEAKTEYVRKRLKELGVR
ncbi:hypothetical protein [Heyndrickxia camelliae]|nr:hypothetical protein [Heyndrickxia camelliae]